jgi:hypothetical protein
MEEDRPRTARPTRRPSQTIQGGAFAAPRLQSLDRMRAQVEDLQQLGQILDNSPRKYSRNRTQKGPRPNRPQLRRTQSDFECSSPSAGRQGSVQRDGIVGDGTNDFIQRLRHARSDTTSRMNPGSLYRRQSMQERESMNGGGTVSHGNHEAELAGDTEFPNSQYTNGIGRPSKEGVGSRPIQMGFKKKTSVERWLGKVRRHNNKRNDMAGENGSGGAQSVFE